MDQRLAIVFDGTAWHVRRVRLIEHDVDRDEQVYRCDEPIANDLPSLDAARDLLKEKGVVSNGFRKSAATRA
jgi:hypothetical protein